MCDLTIERAIREDQRPRHGQTRQYCWRLERSCGIKPTDVMVSIVENTHADWSFGFGRAQFLTGELHGSLEDATSAPRGSKQPAELAGAAPGRSA